MRYLLLVGMMWWVSYEGMSQNIHQVPEKLDKQTKEIQPVKLKKRKVSRRDLKKARSGIFTENHAIIETNLEKRRKQHKKLRRNPKQIDPLYFGHHRVPHKSLKKRAYCTECQIVH